MVGSTSFQFGHASSNLFLMIACINYTIKVGLANLLTYKQEYIISCNKQSMIIIVMTQPLVGIL